MTCSAVRTDVSTSNKSKIANILPKLVIAILPSLMPLAQTRCVLKVYGISDPLPSGSELSGFTRDAPCRSQPAPRCILFARDNGIQPRAFRDADISPYAPGSRG